MRIANRAGRAVLVSADSSSFADLEQVSNGRFGPAVPEIYDRWDELLEWFAATGADLSTTGEALAPADLGAPSPGPRQIFAIGLNYQDHADEAGLPHPEVPPTFTKWVGSFAGPEGNLQLPTGTVDWEAELVAVIGRRADKVHVDNAWSHVAGVTVGQDYSERTLQLTGPAPQFSLGKSFAGFSPQGPWLTSIDELANPDDLAIECRINGEVVQQSSTARLIFSVPQIIAHLSSVLPLFPGDVIFTGTPAGVGGARKPPRFLAAGDVVETAIAGLGQIRQTCVTSY
ncbi:fumarylacetoacetate hydrolase family protein [Gordonia hydrophobica]|uniref:Fumarylacetoacetate hydrolase family protein n=1 Tax=Gordonia hydrophobica TaxID=40516 RepID=A0ABZ2U6H7_9ACTN|nr:fumarylacetoacetate hydrolase family protein [Gordonia hydrophobica]MBM7365474.1 2-keto-4-pentenoate hydratase/2-oxohepta-3-ene-1,7-dioic acid hydratase in catechol pathway [Gordonia hydrophobica]